MAERKPSFWAHLPAKVRYDTDLPPNAKLLYAEITALENTTGYCFARNDYFASVFGLSERTVTRLIAQLAEKAYIAVEIIKDPASNEILERRITAERPELLCCDGYPIDKNDYTPIEAQFGAAENEAEKPQIEPENAQSEAEVQGGIDKNDYRGIDKNVQAINRYNNTRDINIPPIVPHKGEKRSRRKRTAKTTADWMPERFEAFWEFYRTHCRGESKQAAIKAWDRLQPSSELIGLIGQRLKRQIKSPQWQQGIGIPYASTYLNQRRWEDDIGPMSQAPPTSGGWAEDPEVYDYG